VDLACPNYGPIVSIMGLAYPNGPIVSCVHNGPRDTFILE
jgi:hypothetical protein